VSLSVLPEDAERLKLMENLGTLSLTLRNPKEPATSAKAAKLTVKSVMSR
jgi:Flp pilus assembly protein CpaB